MARSARSFGRGASKYKPQPTVLVICEDSKSGKRYIEDATKHYRVHVDVRVVHCGRTDPKGIIEEALRQSKNYDQIFCAIDRDSHESFDEALVLARGSAKISVIASYPCIEFWYRLHFGFTRRAYVRTGTRSSGECMLDELRKCPGLGAYAKGSDINIFEELLTRLPEAMNISAGVLAQAIGEGEMNPSTRMHALLAFFDALSVPQAV